MWQGKPPYAESAIRVATPERVSESLRLFGAQGVGGFCAVRKSFGIATVGDCQMIGKKD